MPEATILVTGGLGFIGSHTAVELINAGYKVVIIDDLSNSQLFILDNIEKLTAVRPAFHTIDMTNGALLSSFFNSGVTIDAIIHFAASKAVAESVKDPLKYFRNNLFSLINLLDSMQAASISNIVFSSSATVYGDPDVLPVTETSATKPALSAYGSTKQMGEDILQKLSAAGGVNAIALRYFNPVGSHDSALLGELPIGTPNNLMPFVTQTAAGKIAMLTVYGNDYNTPDGTCIRDYVHVTDLAKAHVKSCDRLLNKQQKDSYEVFNIGTGTGFSVLDIIHAFEQYNDLQLNYRMGQRRDGDAESMFADVSLAEKELGWKAELGIKEMVTSAWQWQKQLQQ
jgi:UDP-glucose 4-epimerase